MQEVKDTGERREFGTGAVRDVVEGKGWFAGISPIALRRLALVLQKGAAKYAPRNWEKGIPLDSCFDSAVRHLFQWANGETDEDHLGHAFTNIMFLIHLESRIKEGKLPVELATMGPAAHEKLVLKEYPLTMEDMLKAQKEAQNQPKFPGLLGEK